MKQLGSLNLRALKRPPILISLLAVIVLLAVWYLGWMSPEASKLTTINNQDRSLKSQLQALGFRLNLDKLDSALVHHDAKYLAAFAAAVPPVAEAGPLTTTLYDLSKTTGVSISSLTDNSTAPPAKGQVIGTIPIAIALKGPHQRCLAFLADVYKLPRLITVDSVTPVATLGSGQTTANVLARDNLPYTMSITATAYFFSKPATG